MHVSNEEQALAILNYLQRQKTEPKDVKINFGDKCFKEQYDFIYDNSPLVAALCTRRAGKSYGVGEKLFKKCFDYPGSTVLYLALTRDSAKRIMWKDILPVIAAKYKIKYTPNITELTYTIDNGSVIKLAGADATEKEREKFLGGKYSYCAIDEAGSFTYDLAQLIEEYLEPAVTDYDGSIDLIGTPTMYWQGYFCKVTDEGEPGWKVHKWNTTSNRYMPHWDKRLKLLKERNPDIEQTPSYKRMYLGLWHKDTDVLIYKFVPTRNLCERLPDRKIDGQVLGIDLGFNDDTAYSLARWYQYNPNLYFIDSQKHKGQIIDDVVKTITRYMNRHDIAKIVIDNASKQFVESLKARNELYGVIIEAAVKTDKMNFIELMNSDFITGRIKLLNAETFELQKEYSNLIKDPKSDVPKELDSCDNHLCDASLYAWRYARNYFSVDEPAKITTEQAIEAELEEHVKILQIKESEDYLDEMEVMLSEF